MISELSIRNFKRFPRATFQLGDFTLLTGLNGAGKSTVIQVLSLIRQSLESDAIKHGTIDLNGKYVQIGSGRDALCEDFSPLNDDEELPYIQFSLTSNLGITAELLMDYEATADHLGVVVDGPLNEMHIATASYQHVRADRVGPEVVSAHSFEQTVRQRSLGPRGEYAVDMLGAASDDRVPTLRCHEEARSARLLDQTNAWMGEACPGIALGVHSIPNTDAVRLDVGFGGTAGLSSSNRFRPTNVGFGVAYALPIVVACLTAPAGSLLAVENPEAHLHPRGQSKLAELCARTAKDGVQVIVESHSDHFLNGLRLAKKGNRELQAQIYYFDPSLDEGYISLEIDDRGMLPHWPDGFFDESSILLSKIIRP